MIFGRSWPIRSAPFLGAAYVSTKYIHLKIPDYRGFFTSGELLSLHGKIIMMKEIFRMHITRLPHFIMLLIGCLSLTSCFDLVEQIDMNHQGAGAIKATLNLSKSRTKVASLLKMKQFNGINIPSEAAIKLEVENVVRTLKSTQGITNVKYNLDFTNYIATLSCDFDHIQALNDFSRTLSNQFKIQLTSYNSYRYDRASQTFTRAYTYAPNMAKEFSKIPDDDKNLFAEAFYTNIIRFDKNIQSKSHDQAKISANKQAMLLKVKATDLINGTASLTNTITLERSSAIETKSKR